MLFSKNKQTICQSSLSSLSKVSAESQHLISFHIFVSETPLSLSMGLKTRSSKMVMALVNGGAIVDFRNRLDGSTALHRAVTRNNIEALQTLLDLGASPNYKDLKGLTPLYYCVTNSSDVVCCELLLHDRAVVGATDLQVKTG